MPVTNTISGDIFLITLPGFPDLVIDPADVEELENASFYRVSGVLIDDLVTFIVTPYFGGSYLSVTYTDGDRVEDDSTRGRGECHFTHTVKQDEERVSLEIWSGEKSDANNTKRTVVLIFNVK
ncbi:MAG: hypothetical protein HYV90_02520 [Candidatus Woesebacteria bacterium]|nr:MAG: hypothetical protein HYV90_02520 [Candidatus Woesebacteria bacterium]